MDWEWIVIMFTCMSAVIMFIAALFNLQTARINRQLARAKEKADHGNDRPTQD